MKKATKPVLKDTYELYSPVTGAFSEMQFRNKQAADLRRQAKQNATADAQINNAMSLEANRQANELESKGFLVDDQEIKRTQAEARKRQEDNASRRSEVANYNRAALAKNREDLANIEAQRLNANYNSRNNYLSGIENELRQKNAQRDYDRRLELQTNKQRKLQLDIDDLNRPWDLKEKTLQQEYQDDIKDAQLEYNAKLQAWSKNHSSDDDYTNEQFYKDYIANMRARRNKYQNDLYQLSLDKAKKTRDFVNGLDEKMNQSSLFARRGGKLSLSSINLLNKIIQ